MPELRVDQIGIVPSGALGMSASSAEPVSRSLRKLQPHGWPSMLRPQQKDIAAMRRQVATNFDNRPLKFALEKRRVLCES